MPTFLDYNRPSMMNPYGRPGINPNVKPPAFPAMENPRQHSMAPGSAVNAQPQMGYHPSGGHVFPIPNSQSYTDSNLTPLAPHIQPTPEGFNYAFNTFAPGNPFAGYGPMDNSISQPPMNHHPANNTYTTANAQDQLPGMFNNQGYSDSGHSHGSLGGNNITSWPPSHETVDPALLANNGTQAQGFNMGAAMHTDGSNNNGNDNGNNTTHAPTGENAPVTSQNQTVMTSTENHTNNSSTPHGSNDG
ncbi:hypothetical protein GGR57DRAFT_470876 [Xylariaceae sp. FL1272]|nr:hypothetical protein GGR57DRAFT_470876 [Xylariaceae sp. FL1272]